MTEIVNEIRAKLWSMKYKPKYVTLHKQHAAALWDLSKMGLEVVLDEKISPNRFYLT